MKKKYIFLLLLLFIPEILSAQSFWLMEMVRQGDSSRYFYFGWDKFDRYIVDVSNGRESAKHLAEIFSCDQMELRILRNAVYARHGYKFISHDLQDFFNKLYWYNRTEENMKPDLSYDEHRFIALIQRIEKNYPQYVNDHIVGFWGDETAVVSYFDPNPSTEEGSKWIRLNHLLPFVYFRIYPSGTFLFHYEEKFIYGLWSLENSEFTMTPLGVSPDVFTVWGFDYIERNISNNIIFTNSEYNYPEYYFHWTDYPLDIDLSKISKAIMETNLTQDQRRWFKLNKLPNFNKYF